MPTPLPFSTSDFHTTVLMPTLTNERHRQRTGHCDRQGQLSRFLPVKNDCPGRRPKIDAQRLLRPFQHLASLILSLQPYRRDALQSSTIPDLRPPTHEPMQPCCRGCSTSPTTAPPRPLWPFPRNRILRTPAWLTVVGQSSSGTKTNQDSPSSHCFWAVSSVLFTEHASASKPFIGSGCPKA